MDESYKQFCKTYPQLTSMFILNKDLLINDIIKLSTYPQI